MPIQGFSVAFADNWDEPDPTWTRLDATDNLVASYSVRRGRQDELEKTGTGTASVALNDTGGYFDPYNVDSPYVDPGGPAFDGRQGGLALWNPVTETWHTIFRGHVDEYQWIIEGNGRVARITAELVDGFDYLAGVEVAPGTAGMALPDYVDEGNVYYIGDEVDTRIHAALTNGGVAGRAADDL